MRACFLVFLGALTAACSSSRVGDAGGSDLGGSDAGSGDAGSGDVVCTGHDAPTFPTFARTCTRDSDCTVGMHMTDCCGSMQALGLASSESSRFAAAESACRSMYPGCGCFSGSVMTDDGGAAPLGSEGSAVVVRCATGTCTTSVRASTPCGAVTCTPTQVCVGECSGIPLDAALPSHCVDVAPACAGRTDCACYPTNPCPTGMCVTVENGAPLCLCA